MGSGRVRESQLIAGVASAAGEESTGGGVESSLWSHLLVELFRVGAVTGAVNWIRFTRAFIGDARLLRRHGGPDAKQTPTTVRGLADAPILDVKPQARPEALLNPIRLVDRVRHETRMKIKESPVQKSHQYPHGARQRGFRARACGRDVRNELHRCRGGRRHFAYRRKDSTSTGLLRTPNFGVFGTGRPRPEECSIVIIRQDIGRSGCWVCPLLRLHGVWQRRFDASRVRVCRAGRASRFIRTVWKRLPKSVATFQAAPDGRSCEATVPGVRGESSWSGISRHVARASRRSAGY